MRPLVATPEARRAVETRFLAELARQHPGTVWHIEHRADDEHWGAETAESTTDADPAGTGEATEQ